MTISYDFPAVDRLTVGTVGPVGQRLFMLQATWGSTSVTLKVEKAQVAALADYLKRLLAELPRPGHLPENLDLELPAEPEWIIGSLGISYDSDDGHVLLVAEEAVAEGDEDEGATARFRATIEQVAALAIRSTQLVEGGRPPCPLCGYPLDPAGHACPRTNGNQPPRL